MTSTHWHLCGPSGAQVGGDTDLNEALEIQAEQEFGEEGEEEVELVEDGEVEFLEDIEDMEFDQEVLDEDDPFDLEELPFSQFTPATWRIYPAWKSPRSEQEAMAEEAEEEEEDSTQQLSKKFNCGRWNFSWDVESMLQHILLFALSATFLACNIDDAWRHAL